MIQKFHPKRGTTFVALFFNIQSNILIFQTSSFCTHKLNFEPSHLLVEYFLRFVSLDKI